MVPFSSMWGQLQFSRDIPLNGHWLLNRLHNASDVNTGWDKQLISILLGNLEILQLHFSWEEYHRIPECCTTYCKFNATITHSSNASYFTCAIVLMYISVSWSLKELLHSHTQTHTHAHSEWIKQECVQCSIAGAVSLLWKMLPSKVPTKTQVNDPAEAAYGLFYQTWWWRVNKKGNLLVRDW